jgi:hypothetical protein
MWELVSIGHRPAGRARVADWLTHAEQWKRLTVVQEPISRSAESSRLQR